MARTTRTLSKAGENNYVLFTDIMPVETDAVTFHVNTYPYPILRNTPTNSQGFVDYENKGYAFIRVHEGSSSTMYFNEDDNPTYSFVNSWVFSHGEVVTARASSPPPSANNQFLYATTSGLGIIMDNLSYSGSYPPIVQDVDRYSGPVYPEVEIGLTQYDFGIIPVTDGIVPGAYLFTGYEKSDSTIDVFMTKITNDNTDDGVNLLTLDDDAEREFFGLGVFSTAARRTNTHYIWASGNGAGVLHVPHSGILPDKWELAFEAGDNIDVTQTRCMGATDTHFLFESWITDLVYDEEYDEWYDNGHPAVLKIDLECTQYHIMHMFLNESLRGIAYDPDIDEYLVITNYYDTNEEAWVSHVSLIAEEVGSDIVEEDDQVVSAASIQEIDPPNEANLILTEGNDALVATSHAAVSPDWRTVLINEQPFLFEPGSIGALIDYAVRNSTGQIIRQGQLELHYHVSNADVSLIDFCDVMRSEDGVVDSVYDTSELRTVTFRFLPTASGLMFQYRNILNEDVDIRFKTTVFYHVPGLFVAPSILQGSLHVTCELLGARGAFISHASLNMVIHGEAEGDISDPPD